jgi:hypothetical protein
MVEHPVDAGDHTPSDGVDQFSHAPGIVERGDAGMA